MASEVILGIDEAGRGPRMGPMIVAGFLVPRRREDALKEMGVKDSKAFGSGARARERRAALAAGLRELGRPIIRTVSAAEINEKKLNQLAYEAGKSIIGEARGASAVYTDGGEYFERLKPLHDSVSVVPGGDRENVFVAAASILAKDERDRCFLEIIERQKGEIESLFAGEAEAYQKLYDGNSYPSSKLFKEYLRRYHEEHGVFPPETRTRLLR